MGTRWRGRGAAVLGIALVSVTGGGCSATDSCLRPIGDSHCLALPARCLT
jgi:hypothetical protein